MSGKTASEGGSGQGGGRAELRMSATGEKRAAAQNVTGQELTSAPPADLDAPRPGAGSPVQAIRVRQARDCAELAKLADKARRMIDRGEGVGRDGNVAAALGSLTRAVATIHELEREALGLAGDAAGGRDKVIILPVPVSSMEEWQAAAGRLLGGLAGPAPAEGHEPGRLRSVAEDDPEE